MFFVPLKKSVLHKVPYCWGRELYQNLTDSTQYWTGGENQNREEKGGENLLELRAS